MSAAVASTLRWTAGCQQLYVPGFSSDKSGCILVATEGYRPYRSDTVNVREGISTRVKACYTWGVCYVVIDFDSTVSSEGVSPMFSISVSDSSPVSGVVNLLGGEASLLVFQRAVATEYEAACIDSIRAATSERFHAAVNLLARHATSVGVARRMLRLLPDPADVEPSTVLHLVQVLSQEVRWAEAMSLLAEHQQAIRPLLTCKEHDMVQFAMANALRTERPSWVTSLKVFATFCSEWGVPLSTVALQCALQLNRESSHGAELLMMFVMRRGVGGS